MSSGAQAPLHTGHPRPAGDLANALGSDLDGDEAARDSPRTRISSALRRASFNDERTCCSTSSTFTPSM